MKRLLFVTCLIAAVGCSTDATEEDRFSNDVQEQSLESANAPHVHNHAVETEPSDPAEAAAKERAAKATWNQTPTSKIESIDWSAAAGSPQIDTNVLPVAERAKVADAKVPVMLPNDAAILESAILTLGDNWYAASLKDDGASLHIRGTRVSFDFEGDVWTPEEKSIGNNYTLTRTHQIVSVSFSSFGAAYTLDVECSKPMDDVRCTEDEYALDLANQLAVAGGAR